MIVGRDCDGKPLCVGDPIVIVGCVVNTDMNGRRTIVSGKSVMVPGHIRWGEKIKGKYRLINPRKVQKISNDDKSTWTETEKATGWKPVRECA